MAVDIDVLLHDDVPVPDAVEQHQPVDPADDDVLDRQRLAALGRYDADPADVIDQALTVPLPEDERQVEDWL
jgi:hypothetical protein